MKNLILILAALLFTLSGNAQTKYLKEKNLNFGDGAGDRVINFDRNPDVDTVTLTADTTLNKLVINKQLDVAADIVTLGALTATNSSTFLDWLTIGDATDTDQRLIFDIGLGAGNPYIGYSQTDGILGFYDLNAGLFKKFGSGEGGGLDVFHTQRYEENVKAAQFTCGNDVTFNNGGTFNASATFTDETTNQIQGLSSIKYIQAAGSLNDWCISPNITLEEKQKDQVVGLTFYSNNDGNNDLDFIVYDVTNSAILGSIQIKPSTRALKHELVFNIPSTTNDIAYGFQTKIESAATIVIFDEIEFRLNPLTPTDIYASSEWVDAGPMIIEATATNPTKGATTVDKVLCRRNGASLELKYSLSKTSGGTNGTGDYLFEIPSICTGGNSIDSDKVEFYTTVQTIMPSTNSIGYGFLTDGTSHNILNAFAYDSNSFRIGGAYNTTSGAGNICMFASTCFVLSANITFNVNISVPIAGWSNTSQGVVVKNRTDSASVENVFSAKVSITGVVSDESTGWINGNCTTSGSTYTCSLESGLFSEIPNCTAQIVGSNQRACIDIQSASTSQVIARSFLCSDNTDDVSDFNITCQRQGTDYIKETDKVYTVDVSQLKGNTVRAEGNGGTAITASVTDLDFTEVTDTASAWDGDSYTVQENNSIVSISGRMVLTTALERFTELYKNGTFYKRLAIDNQTLFGVNFNYIGSRGEFTSNDVLTIRSGGNGGTLGNVTATHFININETYGDKGVYLGTFGQPTCYVKDVKASGVSGGDFNNAAWRTRTLNTTEGDCSFLSLSSNQFTLESGSYNINCSAPAQRVDNHTTKIYNITDVSDQVIGTTARTSSTSDYTINRSNVIGKITISSSKAFELQHYAQTSRTGLVGFGGASSFGVNEVYSQCEITKVR